jgi:hypothetical protein
MSPKDALTIALRRIEHIEERLHWERELLANSDLTAPLKVALIAACDLELYRRWWSDDTPARITLCTIIKPSGETVIGLAERYGVSPQSTGDHMRKLRDLQLLRYEVKCDFVKRAMPDGTEEEQPVSIATISRGRLFATPRVARPETPCNNWSGQCNGAGRKCISCGSTDLEMHRTIVCRHCGV